MEGGRVGVRLVTAKGACLYSVTAQKKKLEGAPAAISAALRKFADIRAHLIRACTHIVAC